MNILLTGASSFTGYWFAVKLAASGAHVVAPLRAQPSAYSGVRGERVRRLAELAEVVPECSFGDRRFLDLVSGQDFDALCHHAARVANYRSLDFDVGAAVAENTRNLRSVLERMQARGLKAVIATGSVFEQDEGAGTSPLRAFSPYGLSKGLTWQVSRHWCTHFQVPLGKFVIANPFGPFEEPRFVTHLVNCWRKGDVAEVRTPRYLRDNIHVDLLALVYAGFVRQIVESGQGGRLGPCGYIETQGAFAQRVAAELGPRLGIESRVRLLDQTDFSESLARINSDIVDESDFAWSETAAWDSIGEYYSDG